jgi:2-keto-3-deoxy-L-rhamnonate aldolase RhmA
VLHNPKNLTNVLVTARDNGIPAIVSVPAPDRQFVSRILDAGALGIKLPRAETAEQVADTVRYMKYPPVGERDVVFGANTDYVVPDVGRYCEESNEATMLVLKIETRKGVENAESMLANEWVDSVVFGPVDLSVDLGIPGQTDHPDFRVAAERVIDIALERGIAVSGVGPLDSRADFERQRARGVQIFGTSSELDLLMQAASDYVGRFR